jgi:hypothetical protein
MSRRFGGCDGRRLGPSWEAGWWRRCGRRASVGADAGAGAGAGSGRPGARVLPWRKRLCTVRSSTTTRLANTRYPLLLIQCPEISAWFYHDNVRRTGSTPYRSRWALSCPSLFSGLHDINKTTGLDVLMAQSSRTSHPQHDRRFCRSHRGEVRHVAQRRTLKAAPMAAGGGLGSMLPSPPPHSLTFWGVGSLVISPPSSPDLETGSANKDVSTLVT